MNAKSERYIIPNIARALKILEMLVRQEKGASISEIAQNFEIPVNSTFRIIKSLEAYGYVEEKNRRYFTTPRLLYLGYAGMKNNGITENSIDIMYAIRDEINETVMLGTLLGNEIVIIEQLPSFQYIKFTTEIGHRVNVHTSAPGKAIAAFLPETELNDLMSHLTFVRYTSQTIPSQNDMLAELETVAQQGYAIDDGEEIPTVHCVGAPIFDYRNYPIAAVWCSGPAFRFDRESQAVFGERIKEYALQISRRFGYDPGQGENNKLPDKQQPE